LLLRVDLSESGDVSGRELQDAGPGIPGSRNVASVETESRFAPATMVDVLDLLQHSAQALVGIRLPDTTIFAANEPAVALFDAGATGLVGRRATTLFHGADEVYAIVAFSALAFGAIDSFYARRRIGGLADAEVWMCVRAFDVEGDSIALWLVVPPDEPRPVDALGEQLADASNVRWLPLSTSSAAVLAQPDRSAHGETVFEVLERLPLRQREIVAALVQGYRASEIATSMFVSESTVRSHLSAIFKAFGVRSQKELHSLLLSSTHSASLRRDPA
jgi:DNA-binding CsgD family transcriptional regulator